MERERARAARLGMGRGGLREEEGGEVRGGARKGKARCLVNLLC